MENGARWHPLSRGNGELCAGVFHYIPRPDAIKWEIAFLPTLRRRPLAERTRGNVPAARNGPDIVHGSCVFPARAHSPTAAVRPLSPSASLLHASQCVDTRSLFLTREAPRPPRIYTRPGFPLPIARYTSLCIYAQPAASLYYTDSPLFTNIT